MEQRSKCSMLCYADPKGKKEISFGTWLKKRGVERAEVETLIQEQYGISLPDEYWVLDKSKSSRAVKTVSTSSDDEASVEGEKPAPKKAGRPKKLAPKKLAPKKESVAPVEETKSGASDEEASETSKQEPAIVDKELEVEPISDEEAEKEADSQTVPIEKKNGSVKKLDADHFLVFWEGATYVVENEDNCVWEHDSDYEITTYVGIWNPETREVKVDD